MAKIYPSQLSKTGKISKGERKIFALLKENLSDDFIVFHDRGLPRKSGARDLNERGIDFLIIKKNKGILALEVKDAGIYNNGEGNLIQEWTRYGRTNRKPINPIGQAKAQLRSLFRAFEAKTGLRIDGIPAAVCAAFPDTSKVKFYGANSAPDASEYIFEDDMSNIAQIVTTHINDLSGRFPDNIYEMLVELLIKAHERGAPSSNESHEVTYTKKRKYTKKWGENRQEAAPPPSPIKENPHPTGASQAPRTQHAAQPSEPIEPYWVPTASPKNTDKLDFSYDVYADIFDNTPDHRVEPKKKLVTRYEITALVFLLLEVVYLAWKYFLH